MAKTVLHGVDESGISTARPDPFHDGGKFYETDTQALRFGDEGASVLAPIVSIPFEYDVTGGDDGAVGAHAISGAVVPAGYSILDGVVDVITTFTSAADTATIALHAQAANDLVAAIAINNGGNPWDAGLHDIVPAGAAPSSLKMTAARTITATVGVQALTAGRLRGFVRCIRGKTT